jgi:hypothetical protein
MSMKNRWSRVRYALAVVIPLAAAACVAVSVSQGTKVESLGLVSGYDVKSPVKAHLRDGSTMIFDGGIVVEGRYIRARQTGRRVGPLNEQMPLTPMPFDSIVGLETFRRDINGPASFLASAVTVTASAFADAALAVAIFGSCPTIYGDSAGVPTLQAEIFARRISPLLEARDIDLLRVRPDSANVLTLDVRNEAMETHYINHLELLEVKHAPGRRVIPDEHGRPLIVDPFLAPTAARDKRGRDVLATLVKHDGNVFITDSVTLARATGEDPGDHIDLTFPRPASGDSAAIGLLLRSSLLNTVLLYDLMLAAPGARSIDWLQRDMQRIGPMVQFGQWYRKHFGLRVHVFDGKKWKEIERHPTYGPVAWREAASVVPILQKDSVRVRLTFTADEWRIDWAGLAANVVSARPRTIPITRALADNDSLSAVARRSLRSADERYTVTKPGDRFYAAWDVGPEPAGMSRTFLLASQGYYIEWIRGSWLERGSDTTTFKPGAKTLDKALRLWETQRDSMDQRFFSTKIPVRSK